MGVEIESICAGQQTCGKCKILVEAGSFPSMGFSRRMAICRPWRGRTRLLERRKIGGDYRLSCAACVQGPLVIAVPEESQARKQIVRKSATERVIELDPAVRQYYVNVTPSTLGIAGAIGIVAGGLARALQPGRSADRSASFAGSARHAPGREVGRHR